MRADLCGFHLNSCTLFQVIANQDIYGYDPLMMAVEKMALPVLEVLLTQEVIFSSESLYGDTVKSLAEKGIHF